MNVNPLIQIKEAIWVFVVAWFGLSSSVHAVSPPPVEQEAWLAMARRLGGAGETLTAGSTGTNIQSPLATASWTGAVNTLWSNAGNWTAGGPPGATGNALLDANFTTNHQPDANRVTTGGIWMTSTVTHNVTILGPLLTIVGNVAPTNGIRVDNSAFTLTMNPPTILHVTKLGRTTQPLLVTRSLLMESTTSPDSRLRSTASEIHWSPE